MSIHIPFNKPSLQGREIDYVLGSIANGHISGDGAFTRRCHELLEQMVGVRKALLTTSCTHALEMAAILLNLKPGHEVILPSFTFVSTANAAVLRGARPVFADIRPDTLNIDERKLEQLITPATRAIFVVHYAGVACQMDAIGAIAQRHNLPVVEDNAHGLFARFKQRNLGTFGPLAALSFHETKNISCGEGGALLINDESFIERAEIIREKGTDRSRFFRGQVDKYTWVDIGSSFLPADMLAAFLLAQLEVRDRIQATRMRIWNRYQEELIDLTERFEIGLPHVPDDREHPGHLFYLIARSLDDRQALISHLKERGILAVFHYLPLHLSAVGREFGGVEGMCPVTEHVSDRLLRLPLYSTLTDSEQEWVIRSIREFFGA